MAWLVGDGFDFYNAIGDLTLNGAVWSSVTACVLTGPGRFGTGKIVLLGNNSVTAGNINTVAFANSATIFVNMNILSNVAHAAGGTNQCVGFTWRDGGSIQGGFYLRNGGDFVVTSGAINTAVLATSSLLAPLAGIWMHIQVKIVVHNTAGSVELRINGNTSADFLATGLNTRNGTSNFYANNINAQGVDAINNYCDDFYAFNDQGAAPTTFQGDVHAVQQFPTSDNSIQWTRNTGTNNCLAVDDPTQDGDATYVSTNVVNNTDIYGLAPLAVTPAAVIAVVPKYMARMDDAGPHTCGAALTSGGTTVNLPNIVCTASYAYATAAYPQDPNTSAAWTPAAVNAALLSIKDVV